MTACLLVGTQFFFVLGSIWKTWARVLKIGCSLQGMNKRRKEREMGQSVSGFIGLGSEVRSPENMLCVTEAWPMRAKTGFAYSKIDKTGHTSNTQHYFVCVCVLKSLWVTWFNI